MDLKKYCIFAYVNIFVSLVFIPNIYNVMNNYLLTIVFAFLALGSVGVSAADKKPQSELERLYQKGAECLEENDVDSALIYLKKAYAMKGASDDKIYPHLLNQLSVAYVTAGDNRMAADFGRKAVEELGHVDDIDLKVDVYNTLGIIYRRLENNDSAIFFYNKALDSAKEIGDDESLATLSMNLAIFYHSQQHQKEADHYVDMAVKYAMKCKDEDLVFYSNQIGAVIKAAVSKDDTSKVALSKTKEAETMARKAWSIAAGKNGNDDMRLRCIPALVSVFIIQEQKDSAYRYVDMGTELLKRAPQNSITALGFIQCRAETNYRYQRYREALADIVKLLESGATGTISKELYRKVADSYFHVGDLHKAYAYMDTARMWTDSFAVKGMDSKLAEFNAKYNNMEKELENMQLRQSHAELMAFWNKMALVAVLVIALLVVAILTLRYRARMSMLALKREADMNEARQYISGLEEERKRMAHELHNGVANELLGIQLRMQEAGTPEEKERLLASVEKLRLGVRSISHGLMPPEFTHLDLGEILRLYVESLNDGTENEVVYDSIGEPDWASLPKDIAYEVFRVAQEWIGNAQKYADAHHIIVCLSQVDSKGLLEITDDGVGMETRKENGIGMRILEDRVKTISGSWRIETGIDGTICTLSFPLDHKSCSPKG